MAEQTNVKKTLEDIQETDENIESTPQSPTSPKHEIDLLNLNQTTPKDGLEGGELDDSSEKDSSNQNSSPIVGRKSQKPPLPPGKKAADNTSLKDVSPHQPFLRSRQMSLPKNYNSPKHFFNKSQRKIIKALSSLQLNKHTTDSNEYFVNKNSRKLASNGSLVTAGSKKRRLSSASSLGFFNLKSRLDSWRWSFTNFKQKGTENEVRGGKKMRKRRSLTSVFSSWSSNLLLCTRAQKEDDDDDGGCYGGGGGGYVSGSDDGGRSVISEGNVKHDDGGDNVGYDGSVDKNDDGDAKDVGDGRNISGGDSNDIRSGDNEVDGDDNEVDGGDKEVDGGDNEVGVDDNEVDGDDNDDVQNDEKDKVRKTVDIHDNSKEEEVDGEDFRKLKKF